MKNRQNSIHRRLRDNQKGPKQHPWWWSPTLHPNGHCVRKATLFEKAGMEILSMRIKAAKSSWLDLYNVYLPNNATQHTSLDPS